MLKAPGTSWLPARLACLLRRTVPREPAGGRESHSNEAAGSLNCLAPQESNALLEGFCPEPRQDEQIALNSKGFMLFLRLADIEWLEAAEDGVALHVSRHKLLLHETLAAVTAKLPPGRFLRIAPATLVNVAQIKELQPISHGRCAVLLRDGTRLTCMRSDLLARQAEPDRRAPSLRRGGLRG